MEKDADAFRTISEVGEDLDLPQHVLRFWETRFTQIKPIKRGGGRRYYRPDDVDLLRGIKHLLYAEGYTIKGVQRILREESLRFVQTIGREGRIPGTGEAPPAPHADMAADSDRDIDFGEVSGKSFEDFEPSAMSLAPQTTRKAVLDFDGPVFDEKPKKRLQERPLDMQEVIQDPFSSGIDHGASQGIAAQGTAHLFPDEPAPSFVEPPRKTKPKQLALFEGMGDEGLSAKDRETLRQALERIDECRKILASADLAVMPQTGEQ